MARLFRRLSTPLWLFSATMIVVLSSRADGTSGDARSIEYQIKASYIYNFLQFINFPESALHSDNKIDVCILGENRFKNSLNELRNAASPQGNIRINTLGRFSATTNLEHCHLLYLVESEAASAAQVLKIVNPHNTVTVGEFPSFIQAGGLIELFADDDVVRFRVNPSLTQEVNFHIAAQLLALGVDP